MVREGGGEGGVAFFFTESLIQLTSRHQVLNQFLKGKRRIIYLQSCTC